MGNESSKLLLYFILPFGINYNVISHTLPPTYSEKMGIAIQGTQLKCSHLSASTLMP
jgi:hypothetical protein